MFRIGTSFVTAFVLFYFQALIVMAFNHYNTIYFNNWFHVIPVCIINFLLVYSILSQIKPWFMKVNKLGVDQEISEPDEKNMR